MIEAKDLIGKHVRYSFFGIGQIIRIYIKDELIKLEINFPTNDKTCLFDLQTCLEKKSLVFLGFDYTEIITSLFFIKESIGKIPEQELRLDSPNVKTEIKGNNVHVNLESTKHVWRDFPLYTNSYKMRVSALVNFESHYNDLYKHNPIYNNEVLKKINSDSSLIASNEQYRKNLIDVLHAHDFSYFHHHTDFTNFIKIMGDGKLYSRKYVKEFKDGAKNEVIDKTPIFVESCTRFYFKERTPTFYRNEGIFRNLPQQGEGNVPIPVALLFDEQLLSASGVIITDGNAGSDNTYLTSSFQKAIEFDWQTIFSRGPHEKGEFEITRKRNAELLIPIGVKTSNIKKIAFRTRADLQHAIVLMGNNPKFEVNPSYFREFDRFDEHNYLCDYRITSNADSFEIELKFLFSPAGYNHSIVFVCEDKSITYYLDLMDKEIKLTYSKDKIPGKVKEIQYLLNDNISALWRNNDIYK